MATLVRSYAKVNLGLAIGPVRGDGFHGLCTLYQTIGLHDLVTVEARRAEQTAITLTSNNPKVPLDGRNTAWKMVEGALRRLGFGADVRVHIDKRLPVQGGMGAGSANAAAALLGLERELGVTAPGRMELAAEVGSDVPLFLVGGAVLGEGRGEVVSEYPDLPATWAVMAVPDVGVSTPQAFRDWDVKVAGQNAGPSTAPLRGLAQDDKGMEATGGLTETPLANRLEMLSRAYASCNAGPSGIPNVVGNLAETQLLALVRTGMVNDFEEVVFRQHPLLRDLKRELMNGEGAVYAALSGSGSTVFGLYSSEAGAKAAQQRVQALGVAGLVSQTIPREAYWREMFAE